MGMFLEIGQDSFLSRPSRSIIHYPFTILSYVAEQIVVNHLRARHVCLHIPALMC
jgi:hypothetical protein